MNRGLVLRIACELVGLVLVSTPVAAQQGTDFSGHWVLESEGQAGSETPVALKVQQSIRRTNVRGEPMKPFFSDITVVREFKSGTTSETYLIGVLGGTVPGGSVAHGRSSEPYTHFSVTWEGETLVIKTGTHTERLPETGDWTEREERWSLEPQRRLHVVVTARSSADASTKVTTLVYRRQ